MWLDAIAVEVIAGVILLIIAGVGTLVWRGYFNRPEPSLSVENFVVSTPTLDVETIQLLKGMREQIRGKSGYTVYGGPVAESLGIELGSHELDRHLHDLLQARYIQESSRPYLTSQYVYQITHDGIDAADSA